MGEIVRKTAALETILGDLNTSYTRAVAKQGKWRELAEERLAPVIKLTATIDAQLNDTKQLATPLLAALDAEDGRADLVIGKGSDDIWNAVGRPASDPSLEIIFPGGNAFYVEGDVTEQPDRMDLLVELLAAGVHPKLPADTATAVANDVKTAAASLRSAVDAARGPRTKLKLLERVKDAVGRSAAIELSHFKRVLKAHGFSEAEIHSVIPDRSRPTPKKAD
jgi:hypothetical protein